MAHESSDIPSSVPLQYVSLPEKPSAKLAVRWIPAKALSSPMSQNDILVVCLNGLMTTLESWNNMIDQLAPTVSENISFLTYDRYGQGATTDRDPVDQQATDPKHGHDVMSAVKDLGGLISHFTGQKTPTPGGPKVILISNSIGGAITRLYIQTYPGTVAGAILLDSVIANTDFVSVFPDPDAPGFDLAAQPEGITAEGLRACRQQMAAIFHPSNGSREGLSRRNLADLLPHSDSPKLVGWSSSTKSNSNGPYVTVVGHGFEEFARQSEMQGTPAIYTKTYTNPYWWEYNEGLCKITSSERAKGPIEAVGAGHFVQKDKPDLVVQELRHTIGLVEAL